MTLSVLIYVLMLATFLALAGVLALDATSAVLRRSAHARTARSAGTVAPRPAAAGSRNPRVAATKS